MPKVKAMNEDLERYKGYNEVKWKSNLADLYDLVEDYDMADMEKLRSRVEQ